MKKILLMVCVMLLASASFAFQHPTQRESKSLKYNPFSNTYKPAYEQSQLKYNPFNNRYTYERQDSQLKYNPYTNEWFWD